MVNLLIDKTDFDNIRQVSKNCTYDALIPYIRESQNIDFINLLTPAFYFDIINNTSNPIYDNLLNGGDYTDCNGNTIKHFGLKRALIHFSYAGYIMEHGLVDTPFGMVQKMHEDSVPVSMNDLRNLHNRNRNLGNDYFKMTLDYLYHNRDLFPLFKDDYNCSCNSEKKQRKRRSFNFSVVRNNNNKIEDNGSCNKN